MTSCWKAFLHESLTFLHIFLAQTLTVFILGFFFQRCLCSEQPWTAELYSKCFWNREHIYLCFSIIKIIHPSRENTGLVVMHPIKKTGFSKLGVPHLCCKPTKSILLSTLPSKSSRCRGNQQQHKTLLPPVSFVFDLEVASPLPTGMKLWETNMLAYK